jgi:hypothetical protein
MKTDELYLILISSNRGWRHGKKHLQLGGTQRA